MTGRVVVELLGFGYDVLGLMNLNTISWEIARAGFVVVLLTLESDA